MNKRRNLLAALGLICGLGTVPQASAVLMMDAEGTSTSGTNDTAATAQVLGNVPGTLTVLGWIDDNNANDLDVYSFSVVGTPGSAAPVTVFFDVDFANDILTPETDDDDSLDAVVSVFDATGVLIDGDDDVGFPPDPGSDPNGDYDPFLELDLLAGDYFAVVSSYDNFSNETIDDFDAAGETVGQYCFQIRTGQGFDAAANDCSSSSVPVPGTLALIGLSVVGIGIQRRRPVRIS